MNGKEVTMEEKHIKKDFVTMQDVADAMREHNAGTVIELDDKGNTHMICTKSITIVAGEKIS
jgi:hypothetical protein